jgi:hypothetical protein
MIDPRLTRGFLNNNPGNMDRGSPPWNGEIRDVAKCANDMQRQELTRGRFCVFVDAEHGIRAMALNLRAYRDRLGCKTIRDFIGRWAPPNENNTAAYIANVAHTCGVGPDDPVDIERPIIMHGLIDAIIRVECAGMPYQGNEVDAGIALAGIATLAAAPAPAPEVKPATLLQSKSVVAGGLTVAAGTASVADQLSQVQTTLDTVSSVGVSLQSVLKLGAVGLSIVAVAAAAYFLWRYIQKRNRGEVVST